MTRVILVMMGCALSVFTIIIVIGCSLAIFPWYAVTRMASLLLPVVVGGWLASRGRWQWAGYIPPALFFFQGVYSTYLFGPVTLGGLFFVVAITLTAMLQGPHAQWRMVVLCIAGHLAASWFYGERALDLLATSATMVSGLFFGIALLQWFSTTLLEQALTQAQAYNKRLKQEIRERQQIEEALRKSEEALRQHTTDLEARNEELDAFVHTVAHDLKGPLGYMVGLAEVLEQEYTDFAPEEVGRRLRTISRSGRKASNIVDELLLLAEARKMEVETKPLDMARIVAEALQRLEGMIDEYQAKVILPPAQAWPAVLGYGPWVEEVWINYLSNALKYGGQPPCVEIGFSIPDFELGISDSLAQKRSAQIAFWVRDNGPGLSPEQQKRLFISFTQLDQVRAQGHGLGLSIVRRIVDKLSGHVGVESQVGAGSTFWFTLPALAGPADCPIQEKQV